MTVGELFERLKEVLENGEVLATDKVLITSDEEGNSINGVHEAIVDSVGYHEDGGWEVLWDESGDRTPEPIAGDTAALVLWADR